MRVCILIFLALSTILKTPNTLAQSAQAYQPKFCNGIAIEFGSGAWAVRDGYVSGERYSGSLPFFAMKWTRLNGKSGYCLGLEYRESKEIRNNNIDTQIIQFSFFCDYYYSVGTFTLFSKDVHAFVGPSPEFFFYYNQPDIARNGMYLNLSFASLLSLGANGLVIMPLGKRFQAEAAVRTNLISVGLRMVELIDRDVGTDAPPLKFLTPFSGLHARLNIGLRYALTGSLSVKVNYRSHVTRIVAWEDLVSASDNLSAEMTLSF